MKNILYLFAVILVLLSSSCKDKSDDEDTDFLDQFTCCKIPPLEECIGGAKIFIPNAFTPNGDGINDQFFVSADPAISQVISFKIRNNINQTVFEANNILANDLNGAWDGGSFGEIKSGIFNYEVSVENIRAEVGNFTGIVCVRGDLPLQCLEDENELLCIYFNQHNGNGGFDATINSAEVCE